MAISTIDRATFLQASIQEQQLELERLQQQQSMTSRQQFAQQTLATLRGIVEASRQNIVRLDESVITAFNELELAVAEAHTQQDHFFAMSASGIRKSDAAAINLKNILASRFVARAQLAAHETKLAEQENFFRVEPQN